MHFRTQLLIGFSLLLAVVLCASYVLVTALGRHAIHANALERSAALSKILQAAADFGLRVEGDAEDLLGRQMIAEATLAAHLVDVAENDAGLSAEQIKARLRDVADHTVLDEFWITDEQGHAYLRNREDIDFVFPQGPTEKDQAWHFSQLLREHRGQFIQSAMPREYDGKLFKYAGVSGIDKPRIVQVGFNAQSLRELVAGMTAADLAKTVAGNGGVLRIQAVGPDGELYADSDAAGPAPGNAAPPRDAALGALARQTRQSGGPVTRFEGDRLLVVSPARVPKEGIFYALAVTYDARPMNAWMRRMRVGMAAAFGIVLVVGMLLASRLAGGIAEPVQTLADEAAEIGRGNLDREIDVEARGEVGVLADAFREMQDDLKAHIAELRRMTAENERLETEIRVAAEVQAWMLPRELPQLPGAGVFALTRPAREIGGDFYDFHGYADGRLGLVIGDSSGKGLPAALYAAQSLSVIRALAGLNAGICEVLAGANHVLLSSGETGGMFSTVFYGVFEPSSRRLAFANAGHCRPILLRSGRRPVFLEYEHTRPVGLVEQFAPIEQEIVLEPEDRLVFYSDGVTDARNVGEEMFGHQRLLACLAEDLRGDPCGIAEHVSQVVSDFATAAEQADDITVLVLEATA
jgi:sigma-B regulation protein RsbU (phosphoserine phosphatase)